MALPVDDEALYQDLLDHKAKLVVMGAGGVGKSALTIQYISREFVTSYNPTIEEIYKKPVDVDSNQFMLEIVDTAGTEQFSAMRDLYISSGHGFLLVFSLVSASTLTGDIAKMHSQILKNKDQPDGRVPMVLVGNKCDLEEKREITTEEAQAFAAKHTNGQYIETSAKLMTNVDKIFEDLVRQIMYFHPEIVRRERKSSGCALF